MSRPRYAIIPAGAVTDPALTGGWDLKVLCFLGTHTDKLGWCFMRQGEIAKALGIGRSTVQRSLASLVTAGWVQIKTAGEGARPHACHAYRVIMDRDDINFDPSEFEVEEPETEARCPPVHTSPSEVPAIDGHLGAHTYMGTEGPKLNDLDVVGGVAREAPMISEEAQAIAFEIAAIAGHDPKFLPTGWISYGPAMRVQMGLNAGWQRSMMVETARAVMTGKRDGPPRTIKYFETAFATAHERQSSPSPLPSAQPQPERSHANASRQQPEGWQASRDNWRRTAAEFGAAVDAIDGSPDTRGQGSA